MKIKRTIDVLTANAEYEFELGPGELRRAYFEYLRRIYISDIKNTIALYQKELNQDFDIEHEPIGDDEIEEMAIEFRHTYTNAGDDLYDDCLHDAVWHVLSKHREKGENARYYHSQDLP